MLHIVMPARKIC